MKKYSEQTKPRTKLTYKQKAFIKKFCQRLNATDAAGAVYNLRSRAVAQTVGSENLRKPLIREEIEKELEKQGISQQNIFSVLKQNMDAGAGVGARAADSNRAAEILLKYLTPSDNINDIHSININVNTMDQQQLLDQYKQLNKFWGKILGDTQIVDAKIEEEPAPNA